MMSALPFLDLLNTTFLHKNSRDDYQELLELTMIFLGGIPKNGILFRIPRAVSHARGWQSNLCIQDIPVSKSISVITNGKELFKKNMYVPCSSVRSSLVSIIRNNYSTISRFLFMCQLINY